MTSLIHTALEKAQIILKSECSPIGLMASPEGYPHVWARDSVITALGALLSPGHEACLKNSLLTLTGQQSELGAIPNNVSVATGRLDHTNAGSVDSNLWFILGHLFQYRVSGDAAFLQAQWPALERALLWLRYQDSNGCGLLEVHEAADWADLLANRFNILYDNVLWYAALRGMAEMAQAIGLDGSCSAGMAGDVLHKIRIVLWVGPENDEEWGPDCPGPYGMEAYLEPGGAGAGETAVFPALCRLPRLWRLLRRLRQPAGNPVRRGLTGPRKTHSRLPAPGGYC
jgi:hypothetical protein